MNGRVFLAAPCNSVPDIGDQGRRPRLFGSNPVSLVQFGADHGAGDAAHCRAQCRTQRGASISAADQSARHAAQQQAKRGPGLLL